MMFSGAQPSFGLDLSPAQTEPTPYTILNANPFGGSVDEGSVAGAKRAYAPQQQDWETTEAAPSVLPSPGMRQVWEATWSSCGVKQGCSGRDVLPHLHGHEAAWS